MAGDIVSGDAAREIEGVSIDTRTLGAGELYIAVRGKRFDGADFAVAALDAGACGVVLPRGRGRSVGAFGTADRRLTPRSTVVPVVIEVDDTIVALQALAHQVRRESGTRVVAITGSAGKTTTKEVTAEFLATRYRVMRNRGNLNNHIGLPLSLMDLRQRPEIAVVELGMNHTGEISTLVHIAEPDVRVWTNVGEAHLGSFSSVDDIADAKAEILEGATISTLLVANADDERIMTRAAGFAGRIVTFGIERPAAVRASTIVDRGIEGTSARITTARGTFDVATPLVGRGNLANVLAATAVAVEFDVALEDDCRRRTATPAGGASRSGRPTLERRHDHRRQLQRQSRPPPARRWMSSPGTGRRLARVAVLGEMLELGARAGALHEEVGRAAARGRHRCAVRRRRAAGLGAGARRRSLRACWTAPSGISPRATRPPTLVAGLVRPGDLVLVKGSRGVRTDRVVDRLKAERA